MKIVEPIHLSIQKVTISDRFALQKKSTILYADASKLVYPLELRRWNVGDYFYPIGMKGKKKVSDFFSDNKFSLVDKDNTWILCSADNIVWIVGHRPDDRYKVSLTTTEVVVIELA